MKRTHLIALLLISVLIISLIGIVVFIKTFDPNHHLPEITAKITQAIGRDVKIGKADLSISLIQGVHLRAKNVAFADDKDFSDEPFLTIQKMQVRINVGALLFKQKVAISDIHIAEPRLRIIRNQKGVFNFNSLLQASSSNAQSGNGNSAGTLSALFIRSLDLNEGQVLFKDLSEQNSMNVSINDISLKLNEFSLLEPFSFELKSAVFYDEPNLNFKGTGRLDLANQQVRFDDVQLRTSLEKFNLDSLNESLPSLAKSVLMKELQGQISLNILQCILGKEGVEVFKAEAEVKQGAVFIDQLPSPLENITLRLQLTRDQIFVHDFHVNLGSGRIQTSGVVHNYIFSPSYDAQAKIDQVSLKALPLEDIVQFPVEGNLSTEISIKGRGFDAKKFLSHLDSKGKVYLEEGKLVGLNILDRIIGQLANIPKLSHNLKQQLPERWQSVLGGKDTLFNQMEMSWQVKDKKIHFADLILDAKGVRIESAGILTFDQQLQASGTVYLSKDLVDDLVHIQRELSSLREYDGRISIPAWVKGSIQDPKIGIDEDYLLKKLIHVLTDEITEDLLKGRPEVKGALDILEKLF